jgi:hypothetical protein
MDRPEQTKTYEFNQEENLLLGGLSKGLLRLGGVVLIGGILLVIYIVLSFIDPMALVPVNETKYAILSTADYALWVLISLLVIYLSVTIIRLTGPIRLIIGTSGADMVLLMAFVKRLTTLCRLSFVTLVVICGLLIVSLLMMILVF